MPTNDLQFATKEIEQFLIVELARRIEVEPELIDPTQPLERYGLDSLNALRLARELEDRIGCRLPSTVLWDYPTIDGLARYITEELKIREIRRESV